MMGDQSVRVQGRTLSSSPTRSVSESTSCPADEIVSGLSFTWVANGAYTVSVGLDGSLQEGSASSGIASLSSTEGNHTARLEVSCSTCTEDQTFELTGVTMTIALSVHLHPCVVAC